MKKIIVAIAFISLLACGAVCCNSVEEVSNVNDTEIVENTVLQKKQYEHKVYQVDINDNWTVKEPYDFQTQFLKEGELVSFIEVNEECGYCATTDSIITNMFGLHGKAVEIEEDSLGEYTQIKVEIAYEASAAEQVSGIVPQPNELHYIYTDNKMFVLDVYVNTEELSEQEIDEFISSLMLKEKMS